MDAYTGRGGECLLHFHHFLPHTFSEEDFVDERTLGPHVLSCSNVEGNSNIIMDNQRMNKIISKVYSKRSKTSFEKNCFSAWASTLNMGLINKVDMVCLSPVGYGV